MLQSPASGKKVLWQEMLRHELLAALAERPVVIVPVGSVEQHGPHCPQDVDISVPYHLAITAAETGHLVLATLHTGSAARTLDRVLDVFPTEQREQIRIMVGESLRGIISQQLVPKKSGQGRALALELLVNSPAVAATIRDGKTFMLPVALLAFCGIVLGVGSSFGSATVQRQLPFLAWGPLPVVWHWMTLLILTPMKSLLGRMTS